MRIMKIMRVLQSRISKASRVVILPVDIGCNLTSSFPSCFFGFPRMKIPFTALVLLLAGGSVLLADQSSPAEALPEAVPLSRYQNLIEKSPFALATAVTPPPAPKEETPSFAKDFYITGMAQLGKENFVTISSRDKQRRFSLTVGESHDDITLTSVEWVPETGKSKAILKKGSEFGTIGFDEVAMQTPAASGPSGKPGTAAPAHFPQAGYPQRAATTVNGNQPGATWRRRTIVTQAGAGADTNSQPNWQRDPSQWRRRPRTIPGAPAAQ